MKQVACKDVGVMACSFVARGDSDEEVKMQLDDHGMRIHSKMMNEMSEQQKEEMQRKIDEKLAMQV